MKKPVAVLGALLAVSASTTFAVSSPDVEKASKGANVYKKGEILVRVNPGTKLNTLAGNLAAYGVSGAQGLKLPKKFQGSALSRWQVLKLAPGQDEKKVLTRLLEDKRIEAGQLNHRLTATGLPNDPRFDELWGMHNTGASGLDDADIDAPEAWDSLTASDVVVAVIDTGVDYTHEDLAANMWTNPGEIPGNGIDDEGNGFVDDYYGYDFSANDSDPIDEMGHGTHVAGTIAAVGDNGVGVTGVNWQSKIMAVRFLDAGGGGWTDDAVEATLYAAANGARVTNNSWGGWGFDQPLYDAIKAVQDAGVLTVAAAGNEGTDAFPLYPAAFDLPGIISVAASTSTDELAYFSNWGKVSVDLAAPGQSILSTVPTETWLGDPSGYMYLDGTSMATPHVAGAAALLLAQDGARSAVGVKQLILQTVDVRGAFSGKMVSNGRLNLNNAVNCDASQIAVLPGEPANGFWAKQFEPRTVSAYIGACGATLPDATATASFSSGDPALPLYDDGLHGDGLAGDGVYANTWEPANVGDVTVTIDVAEPTLGQTSTSISGVVYDLLNYRIESAAYDWVDATQGFVLLANADDDMTWLPLEYDFNFYGVPYNAAYISANGFISFVDWNIAFANTSMPDSALPNALIAPFWDDLTGATVYVLTDGVAPFRRTTIAWYKAKHYDASSLGSIAFQVSLYESTGDIVFRYNDVDFGSASIDKGASATVGVEDQSGTAASLFSYMQARLSDQSALRLTLEISNASPIANAGVDQTVGSRTRKVTLSGSGSSDSNGTLVGYAWKQVAGPSVRLAGADSVTASFSPPKSAKYPVQLEFELTVTDNDGATATDRVSVTIVK